MIVQVGPEKFRLLPSQEPYMIGRAPINDLVCKDPIASRMHAELRYQFDLLEVRDLESTNGTYLGEDLLPPMVWTAVEGRPLSIGSWTLLVHPGPADPSVPLLRSRNLEETVTEDAADGSLPPGFKPTRESVLPSDLME